jgi:hypothetical protein
MIHSIITIGCIRPSDDHGVSCLTREVGHQSFIKFGVFGRAAFLAEQFLRDITALGKSLHGIPAEDELVVAIEIRLVQLDGTQFFNQAYPSNLLQHHL